MIDLFIMYGGIVFLYLAIAGCTSFMTGETDKFDMTIDVKATEGECDVGIGINSQKHETIDEKEVKGPGVSG
jgi:hypothetical protein